MNGQEPNAHELVFDIRRSIRYHHRRCRHYLNIHNVVLFVALVSNSAAFAAMWSGIIPSTSVLAALIPGLVASLLIGFDFVTGSLRKSALHTDLARQFTELEAQLVGVEEGDTEKLAEVQRERLRIEATEPPILKVLDTLCYNDEVRAMGHEKDMRIQVGIVQKFVADFFDFGADSLYKTANQ